MSQAGPGRRAGDQAGDVGEHQLALAIVDRSQHRLEGGERVVGDLRRRPGEGRQQRRLARVRQPHQPRVGKQLQPQLDPARLAGQPTLGKSRRLAGRGRKSLVPVPAEPPARHHRPLARPHQVVRTALEPFNLSSRRNRDHLIGAARAVALLSLPMSAAARPVMRRKPKRRQVAPRLVGDHYDVAPAAAIAAVRAAARHVRLAAKADHAVAAGAALDVDLRSIVEHRINGRRRQAWRRAGLPDAARRRLLRALARCADDLLLQRPVRAHEHARPPGRPRDDEHGQEGQAGPQ